MASAILFAVVCCGKRLRVADANRLNKLIRKASDVVGVELDTLTAVPERRMLSKVRAILQHGSHPLHNALDKQRNTLSERLMHRNAPLSTTGSHSCLWPSNFTAPPSADLTCYLLYKKQMTKQNNTIQYNYFTIVYILAHCILYIFPECLLYYSIFYFNVYFIVLFHFFYYCLL